VPSSTRRLALDVLGRSSGGGATLGDALAEAGAEGLPPRERALLHELVLGTLRRRGWLDYVLERLADRSLGQTPPVLRDVLRLGAYQLLFLRVPDHAAVSESVALARTAAPRGAAFVNAVLRRLQREGPPAEPSADSRPLEWLASAGSLPRWLAARWLERLGRAEAIARARSLLEAPPVFLRLNPRVPDAPKRLETLGVELRPTGVPQAWEATGGRLAEPVARGMVHVQDAGSQMVARLAATSGLVLDACAAPGGKSLLLSDLLGESGTVVAADASLRRLRTLVALRARWGATAIRVVAADAERPPFARPFDAVLLDAPCSGLGTLARHPDIRWRVREADLVRHAERQRRLLEGLLPLVRPGGRLVYAVCSVEDEENLGVLAPFLDAHPGLRPVPLPDWARPFGEGPLVRMNPARHRGDSFFVACLAVVR
jgi:16S rRNA (cytosine967-C5)-methyltransferase